MVLWVFCMQCVPLLHEIVADTENRLDDEVQASGFGGEYGKAVVDDVSDLFRRYAMGFFPKKNSRFFDFIAFDFLCSSWRFSRFG